jgi:hypothetical protein
LTNICKFISIQLQIEEPFYGGGQVDVMQTPGNLLEETDMKQNYFMLAMLAGLLAFGLLFAGCDDSGGDNGGDSGNSYSVAVTSNAAALTLTLTLSGAEFKDEAVSSTKWGNLFNHTGTVDPQGGSDARNYVNYQAELSADKKTLTITLSKKDNYTGTITCAPKSYYSSTGMTSIWTIPNNAGNIPIIGAAVTFTIQ